MYLINKEHIVFFQRSQDTRQVARFIEYRTRSYLKADSEFVGDDIRECGFSQSRRAVQKCMVKGFTTIFGCFNEHFQILHNLLLTAEVFKT